MPGVFSGDDDFLSCLCGSERDKATYKSLIVKEHVPK